MPYSSLFSSGLKLAQTRGSLDLDPSTPSLPPTPTGSSQLLAPPATTHSNVQPGRVLRRRRSSLTVSTSPMAAIKNNNPTRTAGHAFSKVLMSPAHEKWSAHNSIAVAAAGADSSQSIVTKDGLMNKITTWAKPRRNLVAAAKPPPNAPLPALPPSEAVPTTQRRRAATTTTAPPSTFAPPVPFPPAPSIKPAHITLHSGSAAPRRGSVTALRSPLSPFVPNSPLRGRTPDYYIGGDSLPSSAGTGVIDGYFDAYLQKTGSNMIMGELRKEKHGDVA